MFFKVYFKLRYEKVIKHISMLINSLIRNNSNEFIFKNKVNTEMLPIKAPIINLVMETFLLKKVETAVSKRKSNTKLSIKTKSRYIFMILTIIIIRKQH